MRPASSRAHEMGRRCSIAHLLPQQCAAMFRGNHQAGPVYVYDMNACSRLCKCLDPVNLLCHPAYMHDLTTCSCRCGCLSSRLFNTILPSCMTSLLQLVRASPHSRLYGQACIV